MTHDKIIIIKYKQKCYNILHLKIYASKQGLDGWMRASRLGFSALKGDGEVHIAIVMQCQARCETCNDHLIFWGNDTMSRSRDGQK